MSFTVDARGLACPQPVILTKNAMKEYSLVTVIVDNDTAKKNVTMMAKKQNASAETEVREDGTYITIQTAGAETEDQHSEDPQSLAPGKRKSGFIIVVPDRKMGGGDSELGEILARGFFHALTEQEQLPEAVIFYNTGVYLTVEGSEVIDDLKFLEDRGTEILSCGTCLGHLQLKEKLAVGIVSNMYTITETMIGAEKIIRL